VSNQWLYCLLILAFSGINFACKKNDILPLPPTQEEPEEEILTGQLKNPAPAFCHEDFAINAPEGYKITELGTINFDGSILDFQFVNENIGFALGAAESGNFVRAFKTEDGGLNWYSLNLETDQYPQSMSFLNELEGIITVLDITGCPEDCQNKCIILKTQDGGLNWEEIDYNYLEGSMSHLTLDEAGNLYSIIYFDGYSFIMKSNDFADSWENIYLSNEIQFDFFNFSLAKWKEHLYVTMQSGSLLKLDLNGNVLETFETDLNYIMALTFNGENDLFASGIDGIIKSTDGGKTWEYIYHERAFVFSFSSENNGLALINTFDCLGDVSGSLDCIATTSDGGLTWYNPEETRDLFSNFKKAKKINDQQHIILSNSSFYLLTED